MQTRCEALASAVQVREAASEAVMTELPRGLADAAGERTEVRLWFCPRTWCGKQNNAPKYPYPHLQTCEHVIFQGKRDSLV